MTAAPGRLRGAGQAAVDVDGDDQWLRWSWLGAGRSVPATVPWRRRDGDW